MPSASAPTPPSTPGATPPPAVPQAPATIAFCPTCMARAKIPATLAKGKRVRCPKCQNTYDPFSASAMGSDRIKTRQAIEAESSGWPEWVWALIIGAGCGVFFGALTGLSVGILFGSAEEMMGGGSPVMTMLVYTIIGIGFYSVLGPLIAACMVLTGGSLGGYVIGVIGLVPAVLIFGPWIGLGPAIVFTALVERIIDYKLYS